MLCGNGTEPREKLDALGLQDLEFADASARGKRQGQCEHGQLRASRLSGQVASQERYDVITVPVSGYEIALVEGDRVVEVR
jgi:hypothetical protein